MTWGPPADRRKCPYCAKGKILLTAQNSDHSWREDCRKCGGFGYQVCARDSDTRPKDGDVPKIAAPLASSAGLQGIAQRKS